MLITERISTTYQCGACPATFSRLHDAVAHTHNMHMCDSATQYDNEHLHTIDDDIDSPEEIAITVSATESVDNDPIDTFFNFTQPLTLTPPCKRRRRNSKSKQNVAERSPFRTHGQSSDIEEGRSEDEKYSISPSGLLPITSDVIKANFKEALALRRKASSASRGDMPLTIIRDNYTYRWQETRGKRVRYR